MKTRMVVPVVVALGCLVPAMAAAATFGWTSGTLSKFLNDNAENGFFLPLTQPNELSISTSGSVLADVALANQSSITAQRGLIGISQGSAITNSPTGEFMIGDLSQIVEIGNPELSVFQNEGMVAKVGGRITTISARFVNFNGGTIHAAEDTILRLSRADIRDKSLFSGPGLIQVGGLMSGEIHSEQSLVLGSGVGNGLTEGQNVIVSGNWRWSAPITGTWTNLGVVRGSPVNDGALGELRGARFTNDHGGIIIGRFMSLRGNDESLLPEDQTRLVNNGLIELGGQLQNVGGADFKFRASGDALSTLVNNGTLRITSKNAFGRTVLGDVLFENSGNIDVAEGIVFEITGAGSRAPQMGGVFLNGTTFTGNGTTRVSGGSNTTHQFQGVIFSENLQFGDGNQVAFNGSGATLLGTAAWRSGVLAGAWFNGATLSLSSGPNPPTLGGTLTNTGIIQQNNLLRLTPTANLVNFGLYSMTGGVSNDIDGSPDSILDQITNLGQFHTQNNIGAFNSLNDVHFTNHGVMQINSRTTIRNTVLENHGIIQGIGTLLINSDSTFLNDGTIAPGLSPGTLNISGNFTNGPNSVIEIEMASATVFDVLRISGSVTLGGTLRIKLLDGFMPDLNTPFSFLRYSSFTGSFDEILLDGFAGTQFSLNYGASGFGLGFVSIPEPVPLPPAWALLASSLALFKWARRRPGVA